MSLAVDPVTDRITVWGVGAVGLVLGARLALAGEDVLFVCRRAEVAEEIRRHGVRLEDPGSGEIWSTPASARAVRDVARDEIGRGPVLLCVRTSQTGEAADAIARVAAGATVACVQNGIGGDELLSGRFSGVIGTVYRQTCTRTAANSAVTLGAGRIIVGAHPAGSQPGVADLADRLRTAGYDVGVSDRIAEDRWLKLCINLMSTPNALIRREDHLTPAFVEIKTTLLEEAKRVLAAANITARSCDGRDRSLDQEIEFQRTALERGTSGRVLPVYNQVWSALRSGGPPEADGYHRLILDLAAAHGLRARVNERVLAALERAVRESRGPESATAAEIV